jgi:alpha-D-ribose 1-methylphosphonate 5-triphosphate diphosphatase
VAAREAGMGIVMGAPNLVIGGSHSGNVAAAELVEHGLLDAFSSDYVPASLLQAAFLLREGFGLPMPEAIAPVTRNPAALLGLADRGRIATGLRADLVRVREIGTTPTVVEAWREGRRIA